jgi:hypothetical protein
MPSAAAEKEEQLQLLAASQGTQAAALHTGNHCLPLMCLLTRPSICPLAAAHGRLSSSSRACHTASWPTALRYHHCHHQQQLQQQALVGQAGAACKAAADSRPQHGSQRTARYRLDLGPWRRLQLDNLQGIENRRRGRQARLHMAVHCLVWLCTCISYMCQPSSVNGMAMR